MPPTMRTTAVVAVLVCAALAACSQGVASSGHRPRTPTNVPSSTAGLPPDRAARHGSEELDFPTTTVKGLALPTTVPAALDLPGFEASIDLATCWLKVSITNEVIGFGKASAEVSAEGRFKLGLVADQLAGATEVLVVGHTSTEGSVEYNQALSERRARAVVDVLGAEVIGAHFDPQGAGESQPLVPIDTTEVDRAKNRRVVIEAHIEAEVCV